MERIGHIAKTNEPANLRDGPGVDSSKVIDTLTNTDYFFVYPDYTQPWWKIKRFNCLIGFVSRNKIEVIGKAENITQRKMSDTLWIVRSKVFCK